MKDFKYDAAQQVATGFDNSIDHRLFGHWRNPEYQELCQEAEKERRSEEERRSEGLDDKQKKDDFLFWLIG